MSICFLPLTGVSNAAPRFDEPEDEKLSLQRCKALMEHLVTIMGKALCSTLLAADNLEIIAHTCRALSKLSDANTTAQVWRDAEGG